MTTLVSISTCPRPKGVSYLEATASALFREGASDCAHRLVVSDGPMAARVPLHWTVLDHDRAREGSRLTMWRVFRAAAEQGVDRLIYCEDDILPCKNAIRKMAALEIPERAAFVDMHDMRKLRDRRRPGLYAISLGYTSYIYWGTQCMLFPQRTIEWLAAQDPMSVAQRALPNCVDVALGLLLAGSPWPRYSAHLPCLVRHVGEVSAAHPGEPLGPHRLPSNYPGTRSMR